MVWGSSQKHRRRDIQNGTQSKRTHTHSDRAIVYRRSCLRNCAPKTSRRLTELAEGVPLLCASHQRFAVRNHRHCGVRRCERSSRIRGILPYFLVRENSGDPSRDFLCIPLGFTYPPSTAARRELAGVGRLMVSRCVGERNNQRWQT